MNKLRTGFTLIELLVVISIIGLLATLMVANFNAARERARDAQRKSDLRNIQTALRLYYNDTQRYPCENTPGDGDGDIRACGTQATCDTVDTCDWDGDWTIGTRTYMSTLPDDPSSVADRHYRYNQLTNDDYTLEACLENSSDDKCSSGNDSWCTAAMGCIYIVKP